MRAVLIALLILIATLGLALGVLLWGLDDDDHRRLISWWARSTFDIELQVGDDFSLDLGRNLAVRANDIVATRSDGTLEITIDALSATLDLWALRERTILFPELTARGGRVRWAGTDTPDSAPLHRPTWLPVAQRVEIDDLELELQPSGGGDRLDILLTRATLAAADDDSPTTLDVSSSINGRETTLTGRLGSSNEFWRPPEEGFPVALEAKGQFAAATLTGTMAQPRTLRGVDLELDYRTDFVTRSLAPFVSLPEFGTARLTARLRGDLRDPAIDQIDMRAEGLGVSISARGSAPSLFTTDGSDIHVYIGTETARLRTDAALPFDSFILGGRLRGEANAVSVSELDGLVTFADGGHLAIEGGGVLDTGGGPSELDLTLRAPEPILLDIETSVTDWPPPLSLSAVFDPGAQRLFLDLETPDEFFRAEVTAHLDEARRPARVSLEGHLEVPDLTRFTFSGRAEGRGEEAFLESFEIVDAQTGNKVRIAGSLGQRGPAAWGPVDLEVTGRGDAGHLLRWLDLDAATSINAVVLNGRITGPFDQLSAPQLSLELTGDAGIGGALSGKIETLLPIPKGVDIAARIDGETTRAVGNALGRPGVPELGAVSLAGAVSDEDGTFGIERLTLTVTRGDQQVLSMAGAMDDLFGRRNIRWAGSVQVDLTRALGDWLDPGVELGELTGAFELSDIDGTLGLDSFELAARQDNVINSRMFGSFADFSEFSELQAQAEIDMFDTRTLNKLLGSEHGIAGPIRASGSLRGADGYIRYDGVLEVGRNSADTNLTLDMSGPRPRITVNARIAALHTDDLGLSDLEEIEPGADSVERTIGPARRLFPTDPFDLSWLDRQDLVVSLRIDSVPSRAWQIEDLDVRANITDGVLTLERWNATYSGGSFAGTARLANTNPPTAELRVIGDDVAMGEFAALVTGQRSFTALASTRSELSTAGRSPHEMAANLRGEVGIVLEHGRFPRRAIDLIGADLFGWTVRQVSGAGAMARFECVIGRFSIDQGIITTNALFLDGPNIAITGGGTVDLGKETIDARFLPKNKNRFWRRTTPVHLTGSLSSPDVTAVPARAMAQEAGALALLPQFYLPARALGFMFGSIRNDDANSPCLTAEDMEILTEGLPD